MSSIGLMVYTDGVEW